MAGKNRRAILLVNKPFQFRFALYVCSWVIGLGLAYPLMISTLFDYFLKYLALDPNGFPAQQLEEARKNFFQFFIWMQAACVGIIFSLSLFLSHRIAGPLHKLKLYFQAAQQGQFSQNLTFRKTDYFQELATEYNGMIKVISKKMESHEKHLMVARLELEDILDNHLHQDVSLRSKLEHLLATLFKT